MVSMTDTDRAALVEREYVIGEIAPALARYGQAGEREDITAMQEAHAALVARICGMLEDADTAACQRSAARALSEGEALRAASCRVLAEHDSGALVSEHQDAVYAMEALRRALAPAPTGERSRERAEVVDQVGKHVGKHVGEPAPEGAPEAREVGKLRLYDRADGVAGHYCVGRWTGSYNEYWSGPAGRYVAAGTVYVGREAAESVLTLLALTRPAVGSEARERVAEIIGRTPEPRGEG